MKGRRDKPSRVSFITGQPLGYYSSWPLFALAHHAIVWYCANQVYPGKLFKQYALLGVGDDIVIADEKVACLYKLEDLGVTISTQKSLVSHQGAAEFAKRFVVKGLSVDLSPVSVRTLLGYCHPRGLMAIHYKYPVRRFSTLVRIGGGGYKVLSRIHSIQNLSVRWRRLHTMYTRYTRPDLADRSIELWLGRGRPLNPYLRGLMVDKLRSVMKPKELNLAPEEVFPTPNSRDLLEWTILRGWVKQWLKYVKWYSTDAMSPDVSINQFFNAPVVMTDWRRSKKDENLVRFGYFWSLYDYDMVSEKGVDFNPPCLGSLQSDLPKIDNGLSLWLFGGYSGSDFLVSSFGGLELGVELSLSTIQTLQKRTAHINFLLLIPF